MADFVSLKFKVLAPVHVMLVFRLSTVHELEKITVVTYDSTPPSFYAISLPNKRIGHGES